MNPDVEVYSFLSNLPEDVLIKIVVQYCHEVDTVCRFSVASPDGRRMTSDPRVMARWVFERQLNGCQSYVNDTVIACARESGCPRRFTYALMHTLLAQYGGDVHAQNDYAIWWAARQGRADVVEMLCARFGADVHALNDRALRTAAQNGCVTVVEMLCARFGADVHAENDFALRAAAQNGRDTVVEMLCDRFGADVHAENDRALRVAAQMDMTPWLSRSRI